MLSPGEGTRSGPMAVVSHADSEEYSAKRAAFTVHTVIGTSSLRSGSFNEWNASRCWIDWLRRVCSRPGGQRNHQKPDSKTATQHQGLVADFWGLAPSQTQSGLFAVASVTVAQHGERRRQQRHGRPASQGAHQQLGLCCKLTAGAAGFVFFSFCHMSLTKRV